MAVQETRQKSIFSGRKLGYNQHSLTARSVYEHASICSPAWELEFISTIAHRSRARTDPFRLQGSFPMGTDLLFVFLYLLLGIGSFPFLYLPLTHRSFRLQSARRTGAQTDHRIARATLERARARASSHERAAEFGTFVSFFFIRLYTKLKHDHNRTTIHDFNLHQ